ncbi:SOS response-associated peptidase family protein [Ferrovibrio xuzhouensis]|uniref:SOS response-associated peptidase family protein n=1 Tax=Ferrovibrio xuzhouensis TaxID=1576914 RepID=A0ABV7VLR8_9PROT
MCNRFDLHSPITEVVRFFEARADANWAADYNVAPTDDILAVTQAANGPVIQKMRWAWCRHGRGNSSRPTRHPSARRSAMCAMMDLRSSSRSARPLLDDRK